MPPKHMYLISRNSSIPYLDPSRPRPDSFTPPKGATSNFAGRRIVDVDHRAGLGLDPLSVDLAGFAEQPCVFELNRRGGGFCRRVLHKQLLEVSELSSGAKAHILKSPKCRS
jgi:hypothetical protein